MELSWIIILVAVLIAGIAVVKVAAGKSSREETKRTGKYPKGHYMGVGMAIGMSIGLGIGVAMNNIAIGPAIGAGIGVAIGSAMEKQHEGELRELTEEEKKNKKRAVLVSIGLLLVGMFVVTGFFLMQR